MGNVYKSFEDFEKQYKLALTNIGKALDDYFDKPQQDNLTKDMDIAIRHVLNTNQTLRSEISKLIQDVTISLLGYPRGDGLSANKRNEQILGQKPSVAPQQQRQVAPWANMDGAANSFVQALMQDLNPSADANNPNAQNKNEKKLQLNMTPGYKAKLEDAPRFTQKLVADVKLSYTPKPRPM